MNIRSALSKFLSSEGFLRYFKNTSWLLAERLVQLGVSLFIGIYVARYLGTADYGLLSYARSFTEFFMILATLGLQTIVIRDLVKADTPVRQILGTSFGLKFVGAAISFVLILIANLFMPHDSQTSMLVYIIGTIVFFQIFQVVDFYFQAKVMSSYVARARFVKVILASALKLYFILTGASLVWFAVALAVEEMMDAIAMYVIYRLKFGLLKNLEISKKYATTLLKDAWPLIISSFVIILYMRIDQVMIKNMIGNTASGEYAAAVKLAEIGIFLGVITCNSLFPAIINARAKNKELYLSRVQKLYDLMVWLALGIIIPVLLLGDWVVGLTYGDEFANATGVLKINIWALIFVFLGTASNKWLVAENLQTLELYRSVLGAIINIVLNLILIPRMGIEGAAIATLISQIFASYMGYVFSKKTWLVFKMQTQALFFIQPITYLYKKITS